MNQEEKLLQVGQILKTQFIILGSLVILLWFLELIDWLLFGVNLDALGIAPRRLWGLRGILFAPFLHVGFAHLAANTLPLLVLGWFVMLRGLREFAWVTAVSILVSGLGTWLIGPSNSVHLGASGLIFGYFGYLLLRGYFERSWPSILGSILVGLLYGGMLFGILPQGVGISWQAHLFGFIGGGLAAYWLANTQHGQTQQQPDWQP
jgi:membrane associated rhomboid family serine protease